MNIKLLPLLLSIFIIGSCQESKSQKEPNGKTNTLTDKHSNFPGTGIYILLPEGFAYNTTASGFVKDADGSVLKYDEFKKLRYDAKMPLEEKDKNILQEQKVNISGYEGKIITYKEGETFIHYELSFGNESFREFIEAVIFPKNKETGKDILTALTTIVYQKKN